MATATFVSQDTTTQGNWVGVYGADGWFLQGDSPQSSIPSYSTSPIFTSWSGVAFNSSSTDARALQLASNHAARNSAIQYTNGTASISLTITGTRQISYYAWSVDGPTGYRIDVLDGSTNAVLDSRTVADAYATPTYLSWNISGSVILSVVTLSGTNGARFSGLFFDTTSPQISLSPSCQLPGTAVTVTVTGALTSFSQGATTVGVSGTGVTVGVITVSSATSLTVVLSADSGAAVGSRTLTITTGAEVFTSPYSIGAAYWKLTVTQSSAPYSLAEWRFFDSSSGEIARSGVAATAQSTNANSPANVFDSDASTFWAGNQNTSLTAQFPAAINPASFSIQTRSDSSSQVPYDLAIQYGDGSTYTILYSYLGLPWNKTNGQTITLNGANAAPATIGISYRLKITADAYSSPAALAELVFLDTSGTAIPTTKYAAISPDTNGEPDPGMMAFNGSTSDYWASGNPPSAGNPIYLGYRFGTNVMVGSIQLTPRSDLLGQAPTVFVLQQSVDEVTWTDVQSYTATWSTSSPQTFTVSSVPSISQQPCSFVLM